MRVQILSDLHLEYRGNPLPPVSPDADVVVLAGDLAPVRTKRIGAVMRAWNYPDLLYVNGNHELYGGEIDSAPLELKRQCWDHGVELLDPRVVRAGYTLPPLKPASPTPVPRHDDGRTYPQSDWEGELPPRLSQGGKCLIRRGAKNGVRQLADPALVTGADRVTRERPGGSELGSDECRRTRSTGQEP